MRGEAGVTRKDRYGGRGERESKGKEGRKGEETKPKGVERHPVDAKCVT